LSGGWRDPLVGRDVLVGCVTGVTHACIHRLGIIAPGWFGYAGDALVTGTGPFKPMSSLGGSGSYISTLAFAQVPAFSQAIGVLFLFFFLRVLLRSQKVAGVGCALLLAVIATLQSGGSWASAPIQLLGAILPVYILLRFGLVSSVVGWSVFVCFLIFPMTLHVSAWYSSIGFATLFVILTLAVYGFWTALGNRPLLDVAGVED
jgi:serine/threonine-protein kinase